MSRISFWLNNARYVSLGQSLLPAFVALCLAIDQPSFSWIYALLGILGVALAHLSFNLFDDYFDYKKNGPGIRNEIANSGMRARIGKCEYIVSGEATPRQLFYVASFFGMAAMAVGIIVLSARGWPIALIVGITALLGISYAGDPLRLSYRGLGEITIAIIFGPLLMSGIYYAACGTFTPALWFLSIPIGLLAANILYTHDVMDYEADKKIDKRTLCVVTGNQKINLVFSALFIFIPYILILSGIITGYLSKWFFFIFLTLPQAVSLWYLLTQFVKYPYKEFPRRWWMGPMEKWNDIRSAGIDWFMIRWYLSRNLVILFCVIIIIIALAGGL